MKIMSANRIAPDGTPCFAASHLGPFCLPMSHKKDARLIWVNMRVCKLIQSPERESHTNKEPLDPPRDQT